MWYLFTILALWVFDDAFSRRNNAALWALLVFVAAPITTPFYLASRNLKLGERREGGKNWIIIRNFAVAWTVTMAWLAVAGLINTSASGSQSAGHAIGLALGMGALAAIWFFPMVGMLVLGLFLKNGQEVEHGGELPKPSHAKSLAAKATTWSAIVLVSIVLSIQIFYKDQQDVPQNPPMIAPLPSIAEPPTIRTSSTKPSENANPETLKSEIGIGDIKVSVSSSGIYQDTIIVKLSIKNTSGTKKADIHTWGAIVDRAYADRSYFANMKDNFGNSYKIASASSMISSYSIYPEESGEDTLCFQKPVGKAEYLILELPNANVQDGNEGISRIKFIPPKPKSPEIIAIPDVSPEVPPKVAVLTPSPKPKQESEAIPEAQPTTQPSPSETPVKINPPPDSERREWEVLVTESIEPDRQEIARNLLAQRQSAAQYPPIIEKYNNEYIKLQRSYETTKNRPQGPEVQPSYVQEVKQNLDALRKDYELAKARVQAAIIESEQVGIVRTAKAVLGDYRQVRLVGRGMAMRAVQSLKTRGRYTIIGKFNKAKDGAIEIIVESVAMPK